MTPLPFLHSHRLIRAGAIGTLVTLGLAACSTTAPAPAELAYNGAPLPNAGYDRYLNGDDAEVSLSYGMAETDDVPMDLSCKPGSQSVTLLLNAEKSHPLRIELESGGETQTYRATGEPSPLTDGIDLTATARPSDPVFQQFRTLGWLAVNEGATRRPLVATPATRPLVERFFKICEQGL